MTLKGNWYSNYPLNQILEGSDYEAAARHVQGTSNDPLEGEMVQYGIFNIDDVLNEITTEPFVTYYSYSEAQAACLLLMEIPKK